MGEKLALLEVCDLSVLLIGNENVPVSPIMPREFSTYMGLS